MPASMLVVHIKRGVRSRIVPSYAVRIGVASDAYRIGTLDIMAARAAFNVLTRILRVHAAAATDT